MPHRYAIVFQNQALSEGQGNRNGLPWVQVMSGCVFCREIFLIIKLTESWSVFYYCHVPASNNKILVPKRKIVI